jgi:hypothetical protein
MFDILSIIPGKKKNTSSGWTSFNAICCSHFGHKPDRRMRGGIKFDGNNWSMHCFNCQYKCNFVLGRNITVKTHNLLKWCGIDETQIQRWSLESLQQKDLLDFTTSRVTPSKISFPKITLPLDNVPLDLENPKHFRYIEYIEKRGIQYDSFPFLVTPDAKGRNRHRVIVPYYYKNEPVGHTSRFIDDRIPKYLNVQPPGYVFNLDRQKKDWQVCILTEGIFDALSIDGIAVMHDDISEVQANLIAQLNKQIIVVPDRDKTGLKLCDRALELGYQVSLPNWDDKVKDVNDAVVRYGKLPTLLSILQSATNSKIKIEMTRKKIAKRF